jgi:hypothetical protein
MKSELCEYEDYQAINTVQMQCYAEGFQNPCYKEIGTYFVNIPTS